MHQAPQANTDHLMALRVLGWSEGVEQCPVGFAGVEQGSDAVVGEVGEPERGSFDALIVLVVSSTGTGLTRCFAG